MPTQRPTEDQARHATLADLEELLVKGDAAVVATNLDGVITHWTAGAERLYGWSAEEAIGMPVLDLMITLRDQAVAQDGIDSLRRTGTWEGDFDILRKDGSVVRAFIRSTLIKDDAGRPVGLLGLSMDSSAPLV